jgi:excinuclease ABC subunit C
MREAAADLDFERAGRLKARLESLNALDDRQQVMFSSDVSLDLIGFYREETISAACVFVVREGRTVRTVEFILDKGADVGEVELQGGFLKRYYDETADIPSEVNVDVDLPDAELLSEWLAEKRGRACHIHRPQRGEKRHLLDMATANARHALMRYELKTGYEDKRTNEALLELESALALDEPPMRQSSASTSPRSTAASRWPRWSCSPTATPTSPSTGASGSASRWRRPTTSPPWPRCWGGATRPERMADGRFGSRPDLLILDGGKPQLNAARRPARRARARHPHVRPGQVRRGALRDLDDDPVGASQRLRLALPVKRVRDEAHRFAITFHRELRDKAMTVSILDEVPGIGPKRKKAIRRALPSMAKLRAASLEELEAVDGIPAEVARDLYDTLRAWADEVPGAGASGDGASDAGVADGGAAEAGGPAGA